MVRESGGYGYGCGCGDHWLHGRMQVGSSANLGWRVDSWALDDDVGVVVSIYRCVVVGDEYSNCRAVYHHT